MRPVVTHGGDSTKLDDFAEYKQTIRFDPGSPVAHYAIALTDLYKLHDQSAAVGKYKILVGINKEAADALFKEMYK
jgi:hypothetical protein